MKELGECYQQKAPGYTSSVAFGERIRYYSYYGYQWAAHDIGIDEGRSEGNGGLQHILVRTSYSRGGNP